MTNERMIEIMELAIEKMIGYDVAGLCGVSGCMEIDGIITEDEEDEFNKYVKENAPYRTGSPFRWPPFRPAPRIQWLKQQIEILKNQSHDSE